MSQVTTASNSFSTLTLLGIGTLLPFLSHYIYNRSFYQDRLGTGIGKVEKKGWHACMLGWTRWWCAVSQSQHHSWCWPGQDTGNAAKLEHRTRADWRPVSVITDEPAWSG
jgi:hypothetical protein